MDAFSNLRQVSSIEREGLPFWILWLLLCIILLLLAFIFLRDRDLRQRLNEFLSGAKRRMKRTQLQIRLNREKKRKGELLKELGKNAWLAKLSDKKYDSLFHNLESLDNESHERQSELKGILAGIIDLQKKQDDARQANKQLAKLKEAGQTPDGQSIRAVKDEERRLKKEIKEGEKKIKAGQDALKDIDRRKADQFIQLGTIIDEGRPEAREFLGFYVQIDKSNRQILHYMNEIEKFR